MVQSWNICPAATHYTRLSLMAKIMQHGNVEATWPRLAHTQLHAAFSTQSSFLTTNLKGLIMQTPVKIFPPRKKEKTYADSQHS